MAKKDELLKPGQPTPKLGQYEIVGPRGGGGKTDYGEITSVKDKPLPFTPEVGLKYKIVDPTNHGKK